MRDILSDIEKQGGEDNFSYTTSCTNPDTFKFKNTGRHIRKKPSLDDYDGSRNDLSLGDYNYDDWN